MHDSTSSPDYTTLIGTLRTSFGAGRSRPISWRIQQLSAIDHLVGQHEREITDALHADVGKPFLESLGAELTFLRSEAKYAIRRLRLWTRKRKVNSPVALQPAKSYIQPEPLGLVLIIGPWNYPFQLILSPLLGAIAAGNCAIVKPSELAPATSSLLAQLIGQYLDTSCIRVVEGGIAETTQLLQQRFDHIFYTGNGTVGRIILRAAAENLTPVTLELGGKSPCIIDASADLDVTARRITWGKFFNAGQTCVAPDYLLVHSSVHDALVARIKATIQQFYGADPKESPDYARIVNLRHHRRLCALLGSGDVAVGGEADEENLYLAPTLLTHVPADSAVMAEEIFGPILPVLSISSIDEAIHFVKAREKPLALYVFSKDEAVQRRVIHSTSSGGVAVNHVWLHLAVPGLPFGGVGQSGMGAYHGRWTFETFSHRKAVLVKSTKVDPTLFYPPYTELKARWIRRLL